jgi:hypothetical protein
MVMANAKPGTIPSPDGAFWQRPCEGFVKLNVDDVDQGPEATAAIIRDHPGNFLAGSCKKNYLR